MTTPQDDGGAGPKPLDGSGLVFPVRFDSMSLGLTLRDYFAGQAIVGVLSSLSYAHAEKYDGWAVESAYRIADHMLAARRKAAP